MGPEEAGHDDFVAVIEAPVDEIARRSAAAGRLSASGFSH
jgi:hypothetical protein